jgi:hypothetical protein
MGGSKSAVHIDSSSLSSSRILFTTLENITVAVVTFLTATCIL